MKSMMKNQVFMNKRKDNVYFTFLGSRLFLMFWMKPAVSLLSLPLSLSFFLSLSLPHISSLRFLKCVRLMTGFASHTDGDGQHFFRIQCQNVVIKPTDQSLQL